jgi:S-sulfo-L-cysteine synthase (O-acetyl-L-serine-dependent)
VFAFGTAAVARTTPSENALDRLTAEVGQTELLRLDWIVDAAGGGFELFGKAEFRNPSGSVKDRAAVWIVREAYRQGRIGAGQTLLDASSGNTAVAYASLGARLGFPVLLFVPRHANPSRLERIRRLGARVVLTDPGEGTDGAQREARKLADREPDRYFYADQYNNPANPLAHYRTTGPEIWQQTLGRVSVLVAGVGTGGTISGTGRYLKERNPAVRVIAVEPSGPLHGLEGLKHLPTALRPSTYDEAVADATERVETEEAQHMVERVRRREGRTLGPSSGAALVASVRVGRSRPGSIVVTVLPDEHREDLGR